LEYYIKGILRNDRIILAQAVTLVESTLPSDQTLAGKLIDSLMKHTGNSVRIGISGAPGVGKSTFIESFGQYITGLGKKLAVLTVDPSSQRTKGSILGDKTRMPELAVNPNAFIRPSAAANALGGVAHRTRETILLCEAAGYNVVLVETVGVGQSEVAVKNMTDMFVLLMLAGAGDELQGIKKGIMEMADALIITKADGENMKKTSEAKAEFQHALHLLFSNTAGWTPKVITVSALENKRIKEAWECVEEYINNRVSNEAFQLNRKEQNIHHFQENFDLLLKNVIKQSGHLENFRKELESKVKDQSITPTHAADELYKAMIDQIAR
jgi:LAO/AO transport system kinase